MSAENVVNLYKFQELVSGESKLSSAEDALTLVRRSLEETECKMKNAEALSDEEKAEFNQADRFLEDVYHIIANLNKTAGKSKRRLAAELEKDLGGIEA